MKVATEDLKMGNGTVAHYLGDEVPDHVLESDLAKAYGWPDKVAGADTKAAQEARDSAVNARVAGTPVVAPPAQDSVTETSGSSGTSSKGSSSRGR